MATINRVAGKIELSVNGVIVSAKGNFTWNLGADKNEAIVGADRVHGFKSMPQAAFIEGEITDRGDLDYESFLAFEDETVTLQLGSSKTIVLREAWFAADGDGATEEGNLQFRLEGLSAEEIL